MAETQILDPGKIGWDQSRVPNDSLAWVCDRHGGRACDRNRDQAPDYAAAARAVGSDARDLAHTQERIEASVTPDSSGAGERVRHLKALENRQRRLLTLSLILARQ